MNRNHTLDQSFLDLDLMNDHEKRKTADQLLQEAIDPFVELYTNSNEQIK